MRHRVWGGAGLLLLGLLVGLLLVGVGVYIYYRHVAEYQTAERLLRQIDLPPETMQLERLEGDSIARVVVRDLLIRGRGGDTIVFAPTARFRLHLNTVGGQQRTVLSQVVLDDPYLNLVQRPDGEYNLSQVMVVTAGGEEILPEEQPQGFLLRDVRIRDGRVRLATPWVPDSLPIREDRRAPVRLARQGGVTMRIRAIRDLDARLPVVRFGGQAGWRVEVADLDARLTDPAVRVLALRGSAESNAQGDAVRFQIGEFRTERSELQGSGTVRFAGETLQYQVQLQAQPADFEDLQWLVPSLPAGGQARGSFAFQSRPGERVEVRGTDVVVTALDSRIAGRFEAVVGGGRPAVFRDTRITLDPLRLETLEALGLGERIPFRGEIRGEIASIGETTSAAPELRVDLRATFAPEGEDVPMSTVLARGPISLGGEDAAIRFSGVRVFLEPLYLAALRPLAPEQQDRLRGTLRGEFTVTGTPQSLRIREGDLAYLVGDAPRSRLTGLSLDVTMGEPMRFDLRARAEPLALGTLKELFPALPFETALFTGPIEIAGTSEEIRLNLELAGSPGRFTLRGTVRPGEPLVFDVAGRVSGLSPDAVLTRPSPVEGPVTGTYSASGSTQNFRFDVDLAQQGGRFALGGRVQQTADGSPQFDVAGNVTNFNLGALIGRPALFPSRLTGRIQLSGGGRQPYRFVTDLRGPGGAFDVRGAFVPGDVPSYSLSGTIAGLNLQQLPVAGGALPQTSLTGTVALQGRGTTLETMQGTLRLNANGSTVAGVPVSTLRADLAARGGVLTVDTLAAVIGGARLTADGTLGLTRPVASPLRFRLVARDLSELRPLLPAPDGPPPPLSGSVVLAGTVAGSVRQPIINADFRGQNLRYAGWQAGRLQFETRMQLAGGMQNLQGSLELTGQRLVLAGNTALDSLRLSLDGTSDRLSLRVAATRDNASQIQLAGLLQLEGRTPRAVVMDSLVVRAGGSVWQLANRAEVRWGGVDGVFVDNLLLQRTGANPGSVLIHGTVPPRGNAALRVAVRNLDLDVVRRVLPNAPAVAGVLNMEALLEGPVSDPELVVQARAHGFEYQGVVTDSVVINAQYDRRQLVTNSSVWRSNLRVAAIDATVPMRLSLEDALPRFELLRNEPLRASIVTDSLPLALLTAASTSVRDAQGVITGEINATGTIEQPSLRGFAAIDGGAVTLPQLGVRYQRISGRLTLQDQLVRVDSLVAWNDGSVLLNGTIRLADLDRPELYLTATLDEFKAVQSRDLADMVVSGSVALSGRFPSPVLSGRLVLRQGVIYIPRLGDRVPLDITGLDIGQIGVDTATAAAVGPGLLAGVQVQDLTVVVEEGVWLQSEDARVEIRGELVIFKTGELPRVYGTLQAVRGVYALTIGPLVREFDVVGGSVRFFGTPDFNPELDLTAQHEVRVAGATAANALAILVRVTGTLEYPRIALTSNTRPPLPESELLNYLVFGGPTFQSALAGNTIAGPGGFAQQVLVQELLGGLIFQQLGNLLPCQFFRLRGRPDLVSTLSLNPFSGFSTTSFECGVQIAQDVFLTLETAPLLGSGSVLGPQFATSLEWRIRDNLTARLAREPVRAGLSTLILTPVEVRSQWSAEVRGTWEFGRPRNQEPVDPEVPDPRLPGTVAPPRPPQQDPRPEPDNKDKPKGSSR